MTSLELKAFEAAKEITIAKLSSSAPSTSGTAAGKEIGDMFTEIYKAVKAVTDSKE